MRARTIVSEIEADMIRSVGVLRQHVDRSADGAEEALAEVETFIAVALRVMKNSNPSKVRDAAMVEEIKARMDGREVL